MKPSERDSAYLWDMVRAIEQAEGLVKGMSLRQLLRDRRSTLALERVLEILGEAAQRVGAGFQQAHPEVGWRRIIGQRNIIAHKYGEIDHQRLYEAVTGQLPRDRTELERLVRDLEADDGAG